ncbi:hypothetical protein AMTR_s00115p00112450 [Amborella trichopoda]|uniref:Uncharacterized protein n=1 Tax=Amborella trichopoda TaxID=13333 RepID=W1NQV6_AMBTC|nr:hypothetical protein AMTR_s00115p00112450 [Amborella trichopoda]
MESEGKRGQPMARSSNSFQQTGMVQQSKQLHHSRVPIGRQPFQGFLRDRFTLRRLTERRNP